MDDQPRVQCQCQQPLPEQEGGFVASIQVATGYSCGAFPGCQTAADGTITGAIPQGYISVIKAAFINPSTGSEVVLWIDPARASRWSRVSTRR
jgi:hypothetical protein